MYHDRKYLENAFQEGLFLHQLPYLFSESNIHKGALMESHAGVPSHVPRISRINVIRVWVEEERGTGGNRGKKRTGERGRKVPASMPAVSEREHTVKRVGPISAATKCVSAAE